MADELATPRGELILGGQKSGKSRRAIQVAELRAVEVPLQLSHGGRFAAYIERQVMMLFSRSLVLCKSAGTKAAMLLLCLAVTATAPARALQLSDDRGVTVTFTQSPQRIVSLLPSLTESVCALEQCHRFVGVDSNSNYPVSVRRLPIVGSGLEPNIEAIVSLRPDVVLLTPSSPASQRLESLGIKVVALDTKTHADVRRVLTKLGVLLDIPDERGGGRLWRIINVSIAAAAQAMPAKAKNTQVFFEISHGPYAASESSFIGETLTRLGVKNVVPAALGPFPRLNPEFVVRANPDLIMVGNRGMLTMGSYPGWSGIKAVREQRICVFDALESDVVVRPGPRMAEAARIMAQCIADKSR